MRNFTKCLKVIILIFFAYPAAYGATIYVDQTLSSNCLSKNYSISNRTCNGSSGNAYTTIQAALNAMSGGDDVFLRDGTYNCSGGIVIPSSKNGSSGNYSSIKSYSGEWAILDGQNNTINSSKLYGAVIGRTSGLSYWEIAHFEIKNGRAGNTSNVAAGLIYGGDHGYLHHLYIHDNVNYDPNNGSNNSTGLKLEHTQYVTIEYCYFYNNGASSGTVINNSNIMQASDYVENPTSVKLNIAAHHNEYRYNLIEGSPIGFKSKNMQYLSLSRDGQENPRHMVYKEYGDKMHHNIFKNTRKYPVAFNQDFLQFYNNIVDMSSTRELIFQYPTADDREPFFATVYNNTFIKTKPCLYHDYGTASSDGSSYKISSSTPARPMFYFYNNILENAGSESSGRNDLNILFTYNEWDVDSNEIDMKTIFIENNLFIPRTNYSEIINIGEDTDDFSADKFIAAGYSSIIYTANSTAGLYKNASRYKTNGSFVLNGTTKISNGGVGTRHPYLPGVTLPSYVGATDPSNDGWVDKVTSLSKIDNLKYNSNISSTSNAVSLPLTTAKPPAPSKLMIVQ